MVAKLEPESSSTVGVALRGRPCLDLRAWIGRRAATECRPYSWASLLACTKEAHRADPVAGEVEGVDLAVWLTVEVYGQAGNLKQITCHCLQRLTRRLRAGPLQTQHILARDRRRRRNSSCL
jgi:hypothetical protein